MGRYGGGRNIKGDYGMITEAEEMTFAFKKADTTTINLYLCLSCAIEEIKEGSWLVHVIIKKGNKSIRCNNCGKIISIQI